MRQNAGNLRWWSAVILAPGVLLWFLSFTDYSLVGSWPDLSDKSLYQLNSLHS